MKGYKWHLNRDLNEDKKWMNTPGTQWHNLDYTTESFKIYVTIIKKNTNQRLYNTYRSGLDQHSKDFCFK